MRCREPLPRRCSARVGQAVSGDLAPIPPQLLAPLPEHELFASRVADRAVALAADCGIDPEAAAVELANENPWQIDGTGSAEWAMAQITRANDELAELKAQADDWRTRIDAWLAHESARPKATKAFFEAHLERYAIAMREADPKRKSLALPSGVVKTTAKGPAVKVEDEKAVLAWAVQHAPDAVALDPRLKVTVLREHVQIIDVFTAARFTHSCGCVLEATDEEGLTWPDVGSEVECAECGSSALLGRVEVLSTRLALSVNVPGLVVDEGGVTAKVVPG
jgi:hypothetical protein